MNPCLFIALNISKALFDIKAAKTGKTLKNTAISMDQIAPVS